MKRLGEFMRKRVGERSTWQGLLGLVLVLAWVAVVAAGAVGYAGEGGAEEVGVQFARYSTFDSVRIHHLLNAQGAADFDSTVNVVGAATFNSTVTVAGAVTFDDLDVAGDLSVDGYTDVDMLNVAGAADFDSTVAITDAVTMASTLGVSGYSDLVTLNVAGAADFDSTVAITDTATLNGDLDVDGYTDVDTLNVAGAADFDSTVAITDAVTMASTLGVSGYSDLVTLNVAGAADFDSTVDVTGTTTLAGAVFEFAEAPAAAGSGDLLDVTDTFVIQDGTDHLIGLDFNLTGADHTGADNTLIGIDMDLTTPDAQCTEVAIDVSDTSWDVAIEAADVPIVSTAAEWMEDFWGDTLHTEIVNVEGSDPQVVALALAQEQYGVGTMVSGDDNSGGCATSCAGMSLGLHWSADQGGLIFETRLHLDTAVADTVICAGLGDTLALEMPATIAGAAYTTNASDGAFFCYDTAADTDEWHAIAVDTNTDATGIGATGVAPVANTYQVLRIEVDAGGADAKFYIDGVLVKTLTANVTTPTTLLSPVIMIDTNADASNTVDIDYVYVTARR